MSGVERQTDFAQRVGLTTARIAALIRDGLPVDDNRYVKVAEALAWMEENLDPERRTQKKAAKSSASASLVELKRQHEFVKVQHAKLDYDIATGKCIDLTRAEHEFESYSAGMRDSWLGWCMRVAPLIAASLGLDVRQVHAAIDEHVRQHLHDLADAPAPEVLVPSRAAPGTP